MRNLKDITFEEPLILKGDYLTINAAQVIEDYMCMLSINACRIWEVLLDEKNKDKLNPANESITIQSSDIELKDLREEGLIVTTTDPLKVAVMSIMSAVRMLGGRRGWIGTHPFFDSAEINHDKGTVKLVFSEIARRRLLKIPEVMQYIEDYVHRIRAIDDEISYRLYRYIMNNDEGKPWKVTPKTMRFDILKYKALSYEGNLNREIESIIFKAQKKMEKAGVIVDIKSNWVNKRLCSFTINLISKNQLNEGR